MPRSALTSEISSSATNASAFKSTIHSAPTTDATSPNSTPPQPTMVSLPPATPRAGLDPRAKFVFLIAANIVAFSHVPMRVPTLLLSILSLVLLGTARAKRTAWTCGFLYLLAILFQAYYYVGWIPGAAEAGWVNNFQVGIWNTLGTIGFFLQRYVVVGAMIGWFFASTNSSQILAAAQATKLPFGVMVPLAVMFRFMPTVRTETQALRQTLVLRGLLPKWYSPLLHPAQAVRYLLVPLISTCLRTGDQLAAASMTRGLGAPIARSSVREAKLGSSGWLVLAISAVIVIYYFVCITHF